MAIFGPNDHSMKVRRLRAVKIAAAETKDGINFEL
jgi:hypothetical protein